MASLESMASLPSRRLLNPSAFRRPPRRRIGSTAPATLLSAMQSIGRGSLSPTTQKSDGKPGLWRMENNSRSIPNRRFSFLLQSRSSSSSRSFSLGCLSRGASGAFGERGNFSRGFVCRANHFGGWNASGKRRGFCGEVSYSQGGSLPEPSSPSVLYKPDAIMVLAGGQLYDGSVPLWVERRLDASIEIHDAFGNDPIPIVCLGGGTPHRSPIFSPNGHVLHESASCANYLLQKGIKSENILKEWGSYDTIANGYFALVWHSLPRNWTNLVVITSEFHMPRSQLVFDWIFGLDGAGFGRRKLETDSEPKSSSSDSKSIDEFKSIAKVAHGGPKATHHGYTLQFVSVSDHGIDPLSVNARVKKEESSIVTLKGHMSRISTLAQFHDWFHTEHGAYCVAKQNEFGSKPTGSKENEQDASLLCY